MEVARDASADAVRHIADAEAAEDATGAKALYDIAAGDLRSALQAVNALRKLPKQQLR
jgi:hypothetical protein